MAHWTNPGGWLEAAERGYKSLAQAAAHADATSTQTPVSTQQVRTNPAQALRDPRRAVVDALEYSYGPVLMGIGFYLFLTQTDGAEEVLFGLIRSLEEGLGSSGEGVPTAQAFASKLISLFLLPAVQIFTYSIAFNVLRILGELTKEARWVIFMIPLFACGLCTQMMNFAPDSPEWPGMSVTAYAGLGCVAALMYGHLLIIGLPIAIRGRAFEPFPSVFNGVKGGFVTLAAILFLACLFVGLVQPTYAVAIGPIGIAAAFAIFAGVVLAVLTMWSTLVPGRIPLLLVLVILAVAMGSIIAAIFCAAACLLVFYLAKDWSRRFFVRSLSVGLFVTSCALVILHTRFQDCVSLAGCNLLQGAASQTELTLDKARSDFTAAQTENADTPLRIIAAQGGGLFAAHHTATYLAARADADPDFARSVFAISGVSGGSVGGGIYWAMRKNGACKDGAAGCNMDAVRYMLERDYLSPALAGLLFRDNLDNFLPVSALFAAAGRGPIDRGHLLENALSRSVRQWQADHEMPLPDLLDQPIVDSYDADRGAPLLLMNGTRVDNGERYVLSPLTHIRATSTPTSGDPNDPKTFTRFRLANGNGLSVANAMVISARFPVVTPPARAVQHVAIGADKTQTVQLVDGGYYDNSGVETALDLALALRAAGEIRRIEIIQLKVNENGAEGDRIEMKGTFGAPLSGFFGAWRARIALSEQRMRDALRSEEDGANVFVCPVVLEADGFNFTLSWYLAPHSFDAITAQSHQQAQEAIAGDLTCLERGSGGSSGSW